MPDAQGYEGSQKPQSGTDEYNSLVFLVNQILSERNTVVMVKVIAVTNAGGITPVGFVDVQPMVNQLDGSGVAVPHGVVHAVPYFRMQGGSDAVILDPKVNDLGLMLCADRDISGVVTAKGQANPGSMRRADMSDGLYLGGFLNGTPTQYVGFSAAGIRIHSPVAVILEAPDVQINCATLEMTATTSVTITTPAYNVVSAASSFSGTVAAAGNLSTGGNLGVAGAGTVTGNLTAAGKSVATHTHTSTLAGTQTSGPNP